MGRISEEQKEAVNKYATHKGANLQAATHCQTKDEVDAVYRCTQIVKQNRFLYLKALQDDPKNLEHNTKQHQNALQEAKDETEEREIFLAMNQLYPLTNSTTIYKNEINDLCRDILKEAGFGEKRIRKIIASLKSTLTDKEEEFEGIDEFIQKMKELQLL